MKTFLQLAFATEKFKDPSWLTKGEEEIEAEIMAQFMAEKDKMVDEIMSQAAFDAEAIEDEDYFDNNPQGW